jgi:hypothetical protein
MGSGGIAPPFLTSSLEDVSGELHDPAVLLPKKTAPGTH